MSDEPVRLTHPDLPDAAFTASAKAAPSWIERGWRPARATDRERSRPARKTSKRTKNTEPEE